MSGTAGPERPAFNREIKLDPDPASVRRARAFVEANLRDLGFPESVDDGVLIASELATNAIQAAPETPFLVAIRIGAGHPVLEVHDSSPRRPEVRAADFVSECGRGLHVVDALSAEWECVQSGGGKAVIVTLPR